jgi:transposase
MIGIDLAKHVFQLHGNDASGRPVLQKRVRRPALLDILRKIPACTVVMEACATAHHWAREIAAIGHEVKLIAPQYVKPFVKTNKNDAADAEAICEAASRPTMRFVPVKSREQQSLTMLHKARDLLIRHRSSVAVALRAHLAEFGIISAQGIRNGLKSAQSVSKDEYERLPALVKEIVEVLHCQLQDLNARVKVLDSRILAWHRDSPMSRRLATIPGVGPIIATAIIAMVGDPKQFKSGRQLAAWIGLVPRQNSSGGKDRLGAISKRGNPYLRRLLVIGNRSTLRWVRSRPAEGSPWLAGLLERKPTNVVAAAMANKTARIAWAIMVRKENFVPHNRRTAA